MIQPTAFFAARWFACGLLLCSGWQSFGKIPSDLRMKAQDMGRNFLLPQVESGKKGVGEFLWMRIEEYDLTREARRALSRLAEEESFVKFLEAKGVDFDKAASKEHLPFVVEYVQSSTNLSPAIVGWLSLTLNFGAPWDRAMTAYRKVSATRPDDFIPKVTTLFRPVKTAEQADEWFHLFKEAYQTARSPQDRALCLTILPSHTFLVAELPDSGDQLEDVSNWLDQLAKTETVERLPALKDISIIQFLVAFGRKDFSKAAMLAQGERLRVLKPLMLLLAEKHGEARQALDELSRDTTLSREEKKLLQSARVILDELDASATPHPQP